MYPQRSFRLRAFETSPRGFCAVINTRSVLLEQNSNNQLTKVTACMKDSSLQQLSTYTVDAVWSAWDGDGDVCALLQVRRQGKCDVEHHQKKKNTHGVLLHNCPASGESQELVLSTSPKTFRIILVASLYVVVLCVRSSSVIFKSV